MGLGLMMIRNSFGIYKETSFMGSLMLTGSG